MSGVLPGTDNASVTASRWNDSQYGAAFYIFAALGRVFSYVVPRGIMKKDLLEASEAWSSGEQILTKVALDLFDAGCVQENGFDMPSLARIASILDSRNYRVFMNAMWIARGAITGPELLAREAAAA